MGKVRPFTDEHAAEVAALYFRAMRGSNKVPGPALAQYFRDILLRNPWVATDIPSLMYVDEGRVLGFLGVIPRIMEFNGRRIRVAVMTQFMVDPAQQGKGIGKLLLREYFSGAQDMCWNDGAADVVHPLWSACGGHVAKLYSFQWLRFLRPFAFGRMILARRSAAPVNWIAGLIAVPADAIVTRLTGNALRPSVPKLSVRQASPEELLVCLQQADWTEPLKPVYEAASFSWLMNEAAKAGSNGGTLRSILIHSRDGVVGWAVYSAKRYESAYLLQFGVVDRNQLDASLDAVLFDAWEQGCCVVRGYGMPAYQTELTDHNCIFRHPGSSNLVQSQDPELLNSVLTGNATLTRLDGECWLRFSGETWQ